MSKISIKSLGSFEVKEVETEQEAEFYIFTGVASTSSPDRVQDVLSPVGVKFTLPIPLLLQHNLDQPVGEVFEAEVSSDKITVSIRIPKVKEEGEIKKIVEKAYHSIKYNLIKGLSVGFIADFEQASFREEGGVEFGSWEWYELSLVTVPCNRDASIDKSLRDFEESKKNYCNEEKNTVKSVLIGKPKNGGVKI